MDPYVGEIRLFAGDFAPRGWLTCDGSVLPVLQYQLLFSIIGNTYGGDGQSSFALPDFSGKAVMGAGQGPGLSNRALGNIVGTETTTLLLNQMPAHSHNVSGSTVSAGNTSTADPTNATWGAESGLLGKKPYNSTPNTAMNPLAVGFSGGSQPHNNMQPYLSLTYIICYEGIYPQRP